MTQSLAQKVLSNTNHWLPVRHQLLCLVDCRHGVGLPPSRGSHLILSVTSRISPVLMLRGKFEGAFSFQQNHQESPLHTP